MPWFVLALAFAAVLIADRLSKRHALAVPRLALAGAPRGYVSLRCIVNRRPAIARLSPVWIVIAWTVCAALTLFILHQLPVAGNAFAAAGIGLALGGITGNVVDLVTRRGIVDFIALGSWTVFNIADVAIIGGPVLTVLALV